MNRSTLFVALALGVLSCNDDAPLRRVTFAVAAAGYDRDASGPPVITTASGWTVTLSAAQVSIGPIYFYNAPPMGGTETGQGRVVAQVLAIFDIDVLDPAPMPVASGNGTNEPVLSAIVRLAEDDAGPIADAVGAGLAVAHVAGVATRGGVVVPFDGALALPMAGSTSAYQVFVAHQLTQVPASFTPDDVGTLTIRVGPTHWFDLVAFEGLCAPRAPPPCDFASTAATAQLTSGVGSTGAFTFTWAPAP